MYVDMDSKVMFFIKYCLCFFGMEFQSYVTGQQYNLTGSSKFAVLGDPFNWTCEMFVLGSTGPVVKFFRNSNLIGSVGYQNEACTKSQSHIDKYLLTCLSETAFKLTILATRESEQNSFWRCENNYNQSYGSPNMTLIVSIDVHNISLIPSDNPLTIREGTQKEFQCVVNSNAVPAPTITWYLDSTNITYMARTNTTYISLKVTSTDNNKMLLCRARNNDKTSKTANTTLNVEHPPSVIALSIKEAIIEKQNFSITCEATPGNPSLTTFYWTKADKPGFRQNGTTLQLPDIQRTSSGTYRCTAENNYSNREKGTANQTISVNVLYPPSVNTLSKQNIIEGRDLRVACQVTEGNPNSSTVYWTKEDNLGFRQNGKILHISNIQKTSSGTYRCTAENNYSNEEMGTDSQSMVINVQYPPVVNTLSRQDIIEGKDLSFTCHATPGNPSSTTFYWTKVDNPGYRQNGTTLDIKNIQRSSSGTYICFAENNYSTGEKGKHNQSMVINVQYQPSIEEKPLLIVNESDMVIFTREIPSNPLANVSWYYGSQFLKMQIYVNTSTYVLENASCTDTKNFTIIASNGIGGKANSSVELIVNCKPKPDKANITLGVTDTTGIEFSTTIIAYPGPQYELKYNNGTNNNQMTNMLTRNAVNNITIHYNQTVVNEGDYGVYHLIVTNQYGQTTVYVNILPQKKPDNPKSIKVTCDVTSASMEWKPSFNGGDHQSFTIFAFNGQHGTSFSESINETGESVYIHSVQNLQPSTLYEFYVSAQNKHGSSSSEKISCTTLEESSENLPLIAGVASAGGITLAIVFILAVVFLRRFTMHEKKARKPQRFKNEVAENEEENDDGMKENILYVSAGPEVDEKPEAAVYAAVNKKAPESNDNANEYAEVNKSGHIIAEGALYSDVKPKKGLFKKDVNRKKDGNPKQKKGKKQKSKQDVADVYENSEDIAMSSKSDNVYSNTGQKVQNKEERGYKNKDGLLYVEVQFDAKTEKGNQTIHGEDEKTDYATVEFPMAVSTHDKSGNEKI